MSVRVYIPLLLTDLAAQWPLLEPAAGVGLSERARQLRGEDLEEAEYLAQLSAALMIAPAAARTRVPRAIVAADIDELNGAQPLSGLLIRGQVPGADPRRVRSVHIDDPELIAGLADDSGTAAAQLSESHLMWYDVSEIPQLFELLEQQ